MELDIAKLHHAYLLISSPETAEKKLHAFFTEHGLPLLGSPDFFVWKTPTFGVDEAREVSLAAVRKSFTERKIFLILSGRLTLAAQNALLKTFEDPISSTHFFLVAREEEFIIPTLRSRMRKLHLVGEQLGENANEAKKFLELPLTKRLDFAKKFTEKELDTSVFLDELLSTLRQNGLPMESLRKIHKMRLLSNTSSVSARLMLEHLAVIL